ncbi:MAG: gamma-glutamylcyclotransferase [Myxococcales bacterium]|nr:gamma-glutamylcyclotransferase [Myxococcales bacterium]
MIRYFAYGSNMLAAQMRTRVEEARLVGVARLAGHRFVCNKIGADGSAKANLEVDAAAEVWGVVWALSEAALAALDRFEGGYRRGSYVVDAGGGVAPIACEVYVSTRISSALRPSVEYRARILDGAREHGLPTPWIAALEALLVAG